MAAVRIAVSVMAAMWLCASPCAAAPTAQVTLQVTPQRNTAMATWVPARVKGVVLFSTGHGS